jgi:hypothetical protein
MQTVFKYVEYLLIVIHIILDNTKNYSNPYELLYIMDCVKQYISHDSSQIIRVNSELRTLKTSVNNDMKNLGYM